MTEYEMVELLRRRGDGRSSVLLPQVRNGVGFGEITRTADAIEFSCWPSRGLHLTGIEIKCSRSDWLSEIKSPAKCQEMKKFCHFWYVVAPEGVVKVEEVPQEWGWLEWRSSQRWSMKKRSPYTMSPRPISYELFGSLLRNLSVNILGPARQAIWEEGYKAGEKDGNPALPDWEQEFLWIKTLDYLSQESELMPGGSSRG